MLESGFCRRIHIPFSVPLHPGFESACASGTLTPLKRGRLAARYPSYGEVAADDTAD